MRDHYAVEARDQHVTEPDNVMYIIIALVKVKISNYLSKKKTKFEGFKESSKYASIRMLVVFAHRCDH